MKKGLAYSDQIKMSFQWFMTLFILCAYPVNLIAQEETHIRKKTEISGGLAPKSVVSSGNGLFAAQNMMYRHTVVLFNANGEKIAKIDDRVRLKDLGHSTYTSDKYLGAPVEGVFVQDGNYLWVSNYNMTGAEFTTPGCDDCIGKEFDPSFIYKINTKNHIIESAIKVGSVPKFLAISPDEKTLIVSNWVSSDISIIDIDSEKEIKRVHVGPHPRGIDITQDNKTAFVTIMGSTKLAQVDLETYGVNYITGLGKSPRSVILSHQDSLLFVSLNSSNDILKYNRFTEEKTYCPTLSGPRSMILSPAENYLYVVNYFDDAFTKINTKTMTVEAEIETASKPIGICANWQTSEIWVACYSGKIEIFKDFKLENEMHPPSLFGFTLPDFNSKKDSVAHDYDTLMTGLNSEFKDTVILRNPKLKNATEFPIKSIAQEEISMQPSGNYHIIVGAFSIYDNAVNRTAELVDLGLPAQILSGSQYTYVSAQSFTTRELADQEKKKIATQIPDCGNPWILKSE